MKYGICLAFALLVCLPVFAQEEATGKQKKEDIPHIFEHPEWKYPNTMEEKICTKIQDIEKMPTYHEGRAGAISGAGDLIMNNRNIIRQDIVNWAIDEIIKEFKEDYFYEVRKMCPEALIRICDKTSTGNLITHLQAKWPKIKDKSEENKKTPWIENPEKAKKDIKKQVEKAKKALLLGLKKDKKNTVRDQCAGFIVRISTDKEVVSALTRALQNDGWSIVRAMAVNSLSQIGDKSCIPALRKALKSDMYSTVRAAAAETLAKFGDKESLPLFKKGLNDGWSNVRLACIQALAKYGTKDVLKPLVGRLSDVKENVREKAAVALGRIGNESTLAPLEKAASDKDEFVRESVYKAIAEIGAKHGKASKKAADILAKTGLKETIPGPKMAAVEGLVQLKDKRGIKAIVEVLKSKQVPYKKLAAIAVGLEENVKHTDFLTALKDIAGSPDEVALVKEKAAQAYEELKPK